jgi:putative ABC transport system permease protein
LLVSGRVPRNHTELIVPTDLATKKSLLGRSLTLQTVHGEQRFTVVGTMYGYQQFARAYRWITANSTRSAATPTVHVAGSLTYIKRLRSQVAALADQAGVRPRQTNIIYNENALTIRSALAPI